jgi:hypothetical protein
MPKADDQSLCCETLFVAIAALMEDSATLAASAPASRTPRAIARRVARLRRAGADIVLLSDAIGVLLQRAGDPS